MIEWKLDQIYKIEYIIRLLSKYHISILSLEYILMIESQWFTIYDDINMIFRLIIINIWYSNIFDSINWYYKRITNKYLDNKYGTWYIDSWENEEINRWKVLRVFWEQEWFVNIITKKTEYLWIHW